MSGMQDKVRAVLAGSDTPLGLAIKANCPLDVEMEAVRGDEFPPEDGDAIREFVASYRPHVVINAAMPCDPETVEEVNPEALNAVAVAWARAADNIRCRLIHPSSVTVFRAVGFRAREPRELPDADTDFGKALADIEAEVRRRMGDRGLVLRAGRLHAPQGDNRLTRDLARLQEAKLDAAAPGPRSAPVSAWSLSEFIWQASRIGRANGIMHWSDDGRVSPAEWLQEVRRLGIQYGVLKDVPEIETAATQPEHRAWQVLDLEATRRLMFLNPRPWQAALADNIRRIQRASEKAYGKAEAGSA